MEKSEIAFKSLKQVKLMAVLIVSIWGTATYAENILIAPTEFKIKVQSGQIINVSPGRRQITNNSDIVLINGLEATFECKATSERIKPQVLTYWFWDPATAIGAGSPLALANSSGDPTVLDKVTQKNHNGSHKIFDSSLIYQMCEKVPEGSKAPIAFDMPVPLGTLCYAHTPDNWGITFDGDIWTTSNTGTVRVSVECDNTLIPTKKDSKNPRKLSDGRYYHCCKSGWGIAGTQRTCIKTNTPKQKLCSKIERASEQINEPKEEQAKTTYSYVCPTGMYLGGTDTYFQISYERRKDDEQWCYSSPASGGRRG